MPVALSNAPTPQSNSTAASASAPAAPGASLLPIAPAAKPGDFLFVLAKQVSAEPPKVRNVTTPATALPVTTEDLPAALTDLFAQDAPQAEGDDTDLDTDETSEDDEALAVAAFLPGLCSLAAPAPAKPQLESPTVAIGGMHTESTSLAAAEAFVEATDRGTSDTDSPTTPTPPSTQAAHAAQANSGITHHMAASPDAARMARDLRAAVGTPAWNDELGGQLTWMAANGRESASLRLSPENMGPLEIRISVQDGEAKVWFGAANADTCSALEQSLPRLRELFASQGLVLADAGVHRDASRQGSSANTFGGTASGAEIEAEAGVNSVTIAHAGLIDTYV